MPSFLSTLLEGLKVSRIVSYLNFWRTVYLVDCLTLARFALITVFGSGLLWVFEVEINEDWLVLGFYSRIIVFKWSADWLASCFANVPVYRSLSLSEFIPYPSNVVRSCLDTFRFLDPRSKLSYSRLLLADEWISAPESSSSESHLCSSERFSLRLKS